MEPRHDLPLLVWVTGSDLSRWTPLLKRLQSNYRIIALGGGDGEQVEALRMQGFEAHLHSVGNIVRPGRDVAALRRLRRQLVDLHPEVAVFTGTKMGMVGPLVGRLARVPLVVRLISGLGALYSYATPKVLWRRRMLQWVFKLSRNLADLTLFQTPGDRARCLRLGLVEASRSRVIAALGSPVEPPAEVEGDDLLRLAVRRRLGLPDDAEIVFMQTRLTSSEGLSDLEHAVPLTRGLRPKCHFVLSGHREVEALDALSDGQVSKLQDKVLWLGKRQDDDDLLRAADLFVYPSFYREGVPRSLLRASLFGLPIVAADTDSCRQVVEHGETGLLVPRQRPQKLADAITTLLADRSSALKMAEEGRRRTAQRYALDGAANELHRHLHFLLLTAASRRSQSFSTGPLDHSL